MAHSAAASAFSSLPASITIMAIIMAMKYRNNGVMAYGVAMAKIAQWRNGNGVESQRSSYGEMALIVMA